MAGGTELYYMDLDISDSLWSNTMYVFLLFVYIMLGITFSAKYLNTEQSCSTDALTFMWMFSWIFGKRAADEVDKCIVRENKNIIDSIQGPIKQDFNDLRRKMETNMDKIDGDMSKLQTAYLQSEGKVNNLAIAIQNNILAIKEGMSKILAAFIVQKHMNNGTLAVVKSDNAKLDKLVNKVKKF